jgi:hypothetical protein
MLRVGLVSDTHGLLRPEVKSFLAGSRHIVHAGDIGDPDLLQELRGIAPVIAVRGNNDRGRWAVTLPNSTLVQVGEITVYVVHDLAEMDIDPRTAQVRVVVSGHSHKPHVEDRDGILFINPGSAGPRRFKLPVSAAELMIVGNTVTARIVPFWPGTGRPDSRAVRAPTSTSGRRGNLTAQANRRRPRSPSG